MKEIKINELRKEQKRDMRSVLIIELILLVIVSCFYFKEVVNIIYPSNYIMSSVGVTKTDEKHQGLDLRLSLDEQFQSTMYYFEIYEDGNLTKRELLNISAKNASQQEIVFIPIENNEGKYDKIAIVRASDQDGYGEVNYSLPRAYEGEFCQSILECGRMKIDPRQNLILNIMYFQEEDTTENFSISCRQFNKLSEEEQQEIFKQLDFAIVLRGIYSDLPVEETRNLIEIIEGEQ